MLVLVRMCILHSTTYVFCPKYTLIETCLACHWRSCLSLVLANECLQQRKPACQAWGFYYYITEKKLNYMSSTCSYPTKHVRNYQWRESWNQSWRKEYWALLDEHLYLICILNYFLYFEDQSFNWCHLCGQQRLDCLVPPQATWCRAIMTWTSMGRHQIKWPTPSRQTSVLTASVSHGRFPSFWHGI